MHITEYVGLVSPGGVARSQQVIGEANGSVTAPLPQNCHPLVYLKTSRHKNSPSVCCYNSQHSMRERTCYRACHTGAYTSLSIHNSPSEVNRLDRCQTLESLPHFSKE